MHETRSTAAVGGKAVSGKGRGRAGARGGRGASRRGTARGGGRHTRPRQCWKICVLCLAHQVRIQVPTILSKDIASAAAAMQRMGTRHTFVSRLALSAALDRKLSAWLR